MRLLLFLRFFSPKNLSVSVLAFSGKGQ